MSKTIKQKPIIKGAKVLTTAARVPKAFIKSGADATKEQASPQDEAQSPQGYAADTLERGGKEVQERVKQGGERVGGTIKKQVRKLVLKRRTVKEQSTYKSKGASNAQKSPKQSTLTRAVKVKSRGKSSAFSNSKQSMAKPKSIATATTKPITPTRTVAKQTVKSTARATKNTIKTTTKKAAKGTVKTAVKGTIKTAKHAIKTTKTAVKATARSIKTMKQTAKIAAKTAKVAAKAAVQAAKLAVKVAVQAAKIAVKVTVAVVKAIIAAVKALIAAIAAGGWVAVLIIVIVAIVAAIICSVFGVFWSNEVTEDAPMTQAIVEIQEGFQSEIDKNIEHLSGSTAHDELKIIYTGGMDGDSDLANNWSDVIGIYSTVLTMGEDYGTDAIIVTPEKRQVLKNIFYDMNKVNYTTDTKIITEKIMENGKEKEVETITLYIYIEVESMTWEDGAKYYSFTEHQMQAITEIMSPAYYSMFAKLLGVDIYGGENPDDLKDIISNLPANERAKIIIETAMSRLGDPYSQPKRGQGRYIDCSWLTYIAYKAAGISIPTTSVEQAKYCYDNNFMVGYNELQPGDLVFWSKPSCGCGRWNEIHHVAIYCGNGKIVEASSSVGKVVYRDIWGLDGGRWTIFGIGRPT